MFAATATMGAPATGGSATLLENGMVRIPAGRFVQGHDDAERPDESPAHAVDVASFDLDATLVTRKAFAQFVDQTKYVTTAERLGAGIGSQEGMADWSWERMPHASWRRPFRDENDDTRAFLADDAPAVMVSWDDAVAYCTHLKKRLPTESEWEYAMRAGTSGTRYPWGSDPKIDGRYRLNFWQGTSHHENLRQDGFVYVSPVRAFPPNDWGIYDAVGNVWQWTADVYDKDAYGTAPEGLVNHEAHTPEGRNDVPGGPNRDAKIVSGDAPSEKMRVLRGGSWWCGACTCEGNGLFYRGKAESKAPFNNNGFRCARDVPLSG